MNYLEDVPEGDDTANLPVKERCSANGLEAGAILMAMLAVRIPKEIEERLEGLAQRTGRSKSYHVPLAILEYLDHLEGFHLAVERLEQNLPGIPLEEVERRLGLED